MSLINRINESSLVNDDPGYISDSAMECLHLAIMYENMNPDEIAEFVSESSNYEGIFESQKNIVRLNKEAKLQRAYKTAILQCAAEDGRKEYKKLRTLWKLEAALFKKLERTYKTRAMSRARVAVKELAKKKRNNNIIATVTQRANKAIDKKMMGGTDSLKTQGIKKGK